jgi:putative membrane protein
MKGSKVMNKSHHSSLSIFGLAIAGTLTFGVVAEDTTKDTTSSTSPTVQKEIDNSNTDTQKDVGTSSPSARSETTGATDEKAKTATLSDVDLLAKLHAINEHEIEIGKLASEHGTSKEVRNYGNDLVQDHTKSDRELLSLAQSRKFSLSKANIGSLENESKESISKIRGLSGTEFDNAFLDEMIRGHEKAISLVSNSIDNVKDKKTKSFLDKQLPILRKHEAHASHLKKTEEATPKAGE